MRAIVASETVTFTIAGEILPRLSSEQYKPGPLLDRIDVNAFPPEPVSAQFIGTSQDWNDHLTMIHRWAYKAILNALKSAQQEPRDNTSYNQYFEMGYIWGFRDGAAERRKDVIARFHKMATRMSTQSIIYQKAAAKIVDNQEAMAWTIRNSSEPIRLCPHSLNDDWLRFNYFRSARWMRALIFIHEISHAAADT